MKKKSSSVPPVVGLMVELHSLQAKPELNGRQGLLMRKLDGDRCEVRDVEDGLPRSIKIANLVVADPMIEQFYEKKGMLGESECHLLTDRVKARAKKVAKSETLCQNAGFVNDAP